MIRKRESTVCHVCGGTGEECGCGQGYCTHCNRTGFLAMAPFESDFTFEYEVDQELMKFWAGRFDQYSARFNKTVLDFVQDCALASSGKFLPLEEATAFLDFWDNPSRNSTLGEFIERIIVRAVENNLNS